MQVGLVRFWLLQIPSLLSTAHRFRKQIRKKVNKQHKQKLKTKDCNHSITRQTVETITKFPSKMEFSLNLGSFGEGQKYKYRNNWHVIELPVMVNKSYILTIHDKHLI